MGVEVRVMPEGIRLHAWHHVSMSIGPTPVVTCMSAKQKMSASRVIQ